MTSNNCYKYPCHYVLDRLQLPEKTALGHHSIPSRAKLAMATSGVNVCYQNVVSCTICLNDTSLQVLRYSALFAGVCYGFYHQSSLSAQQKLNEINREYQAKQSLIAKAKAEFTKKTMPSDSKTAGGGSKYIGHSHTCDAGYWMGERGLFQISLANAEALIVITDPNDANFDLEAYLTMKMADEAK